MNDDSAWSDFRARHEAAIAAFVAGDPAPYKALWSMADDVTIFGGWGAYEQGWNEVGRRLDWASSRYSGGAVQIEPISCHVDERLASMIDLERNEARLDGLATSAAFVLRVTHVCRREDVGWRIVHRHADFMRPREEAPGTTGA